MRKRVVAFIMSFALVMGCHSGEIAPNSPKVLSGAPGASSSGQPSSVTSTAPSVVVSTVNGVTTFSISSSSMPSTSVSTTVTVDGSGDYLIVINGTDISTITKGLTAPEKAILGITTNDAGTVTVRVKAGTDLNRVIIGSTSSASASPSASPSPATTASPSGSPSTTPSPSPSASATVTPSPSPSASASPSASPTPTPTPTPTPSVTVSPTPTPTPTVTPSATTLPARAAIKRTAAGEIEVTMGESFAQVISSPPTPSTWTPATIKDAVAKGDLLISLKGASGTTTDTVSNGGHTHTIKVAGGSGEGWLVVTDKAGVEVVILGNHSFFDGDTLVYNKADHLPVSGTTFIAP